MPKPKDRLAVRRLKADAADRSAASAYAADNPHAFAPSHATDDRFFAARGGCSFLAVGPDGGVRGLLLGAVLSRWYPDRTRPADGRPRLRPGPPVARAYAACGDGRTTVAALATAFRNFVAAARGTLGRRAVYYGPSPTRADADVTAAGFVDAGFVHYGAGCVGPFANSKRTDHMLQVECPARMVWTADVGEADVRRLGQAFLADQKVAAEAGGDPFEWS